MIDREKVSMSRSQLLEFARTVYSDACYGHLDLAENYCEKAVDGIFRSLSSHPAEEKKTHGGDTQGELWSDAIQVMMPPQQQQQNLFVTRQILTNDVTITNNTITIV